MKPDVVADPLDDDALQVVVQDPAGDPAERLERERVAAQEGLEGLVEREPRVHRARPRQHEHEAHSDRVAAPT